MTFDPKYARTNRYPIICKEDGCVKVSKVSGYCRTHYSRAQSAKYQGTSDGIKTGSRPKLTEADVAEARKMRAKFVSNREIAMHFGVSPNTILRLFASKYKAAS